MDNEITYTKSYETLKTEIKEELSKSVESFVRIGYLLKVARDTNILENSPYKNMEEFAYAEFKIDKGTASKFMAINDRFSEGGNSERLKQEYNGIGWSKLSIMLQLPDSANEEISAGFSKNEIQTLRDEFASAEKETPIETVLEGETGTTAAVEDILYKAIRQLGESEPDIYAGIHGAIKREDDTYDLNRIKEVMAPSEEMIYSIRIRGIGRIMLSVKSFEETVTMVNERTGEKETRDWGEVAYAWNQIIDLEKNTEENWETVYGQSFPKKVKVAPVQPKKDTKVKKVNEKPKKKEIKPKESITKISENDTKPEENVHETWEDQNLHEYEETIPEPDPMEETQEQEHLAEREEQQEDNTPIEGQQSIEDMPEVMPKPVMDRRTYEERKESYLNSFEDNVGCAMANKEGGNWELVKADMQDALHYIDLLIELDKMEVEDEE